MRRKDSTIVIRASAGTGKTFQLTNRFISLLKDGVQPDHILAVTFTRLAAGEILERVLLRLAQAATNANECEKLATILNDPSFTREHSLNLLQELTRNLHRLRIETLDAYFAQLARSFSLEIGLPANWEIIEEVQDRRLRAEALEKTIVDDHDRTVTRLIRTLFQGEAKRSVTFQLADAVNNLFSVLLETEPEAWDNFPDLKPLDRESIHSAILRLESAEFPQHKSIDKARTDNLESAKTGNWEKFVTRGVAAQVLQGKTSYYRKEFSDELISVYQEIIGHARAVIVKQLRAQTLANFEILSRFQKHYRELKQRYRGIRFEDVTHSLMELGKSADANEQNFRLDTEISHLLLDEFQDTSLRQWHIVRPLAERITGGARMLFESAWSSFFCVGDVKQAIYGWRGGRSEIFDALEKHLDGIREQELNVSYRSAPVIISAVNQAFKKMATHDNLKDVEEAVRRWCEEFPEHETALTEYDGFVQLETAPLVDWPEESVPAYAQQEANFEFAAEKIKDLHELAPERTIGVLLRKNDSVARMIYELRKLGVKASEEKGGNPLTDSAAVQLILSLLKLADHPSDEIAAFHLASSPIAERVGLDRRLNREAVLQLSRDTRKQLLEGGYGGLVSTWADWLKVDCNPRDRRRLQQLVELAYRYDSVSSIRTTEFLNYVASERIADPLISNIRVMTIHQSKGLEFDTVVLPELESKIDDCTRSLVWDSADPTESIDRVCIYRNQDLQEVLPPEFQRMFDMAKDREAIESLCLLYVAMTRAAHALYMIISPGKSSKKSRTFSGLLHEAFAPDAELQGGTILYSEGNEAWTSEEDSANSTETALLEMPSSLGFEVQDSQRFEFLSPSALEGGDRINAAQLLAPEHSTALQRGTVIHGLFEEIKWIDDLPSEERLNTVARRLSESLVSPEKMVSEFRRMLNSEEIVKVLSEDYYRQPFDESVIDALPGRIDIQSIRLEVHNERTFVVPFEDQMLNGTIDRLVLIYDNHGLQAADIVDYKTDQLSADDPAGIDLRADHYRPQIEAYRQAVSAMFGLSVEQVSARLLFVGLGMVYPIHSAPAASPAPDQIW